MHASYDYWIFLPILHCQQMFHRTPEHIYPNWAVWIPLCGCGFCHWVEVEIWFFPFLRQQRTILLKEMYGTTCIIGIFTDESCLRLNFSSISATLIGLSFHILLKDQTMDPITVTAYSDLWVEPGDRRFLCSSPLRAKLIPREIT